MITGMFEGSNSTIVLGEEEIALCSKFIEFKNIEKTAERQTKEIAADLKARLVQKATGNPEERKLSAIAGRYNISWSRFDTKRVDGDALKKAGLFDQYSKISESGRFSVTEKKGA
jgi:predicted phage-related endonuclease